MSDAPLNQEQIAQAELQAAKEGYIHRALVGFDQFIGSLIGLPNDQTISSATEIAAHRNAWYSFLAKGLNAGLDVLQASHGQKAQIDDVVRAEEVIKTDTAALAKETDSAGANL